MNKLTSLFLYFQSNTMYGFQFNFQNKTTSLIKVSIDKKLKYFHHILYAILILNNYNFKKSINDIAYCYNIYFTRIFNYTLFNKTLKEDLAILAGIGSSYTDLPKYHNCIINKIRQLNFSKQTYHSTNWSKYYEPAGID